MTTYRHSVHSPTKQLARNSFGKISNDLDKKVGRNPKYTDVLPIVDTGDNARKRDVRLEEIRRNFKFQRNEIFRRIKLLSLVKLMIQVSSAKSQNDAETVSRQLNNNADLIPETMSSKAESKRQTLHKLITGSGEHDEKDSLTVPSTNNGSKPHCVSGDCPYLLLDVRDTSDYDQWHIITALNYPSRLLSRTMDYETKEMLLYKNGRDRIIVVYDEDETIANRVASTLIQRYYDNVYMLSGGLNYALEKFPFGLVTGTHTFEEAEFSSSITSAKESSRTLPHSRSSSTYARSVSSVSCSSLANRIRALSVSRASAAARNACGRPTPTRRLLHRKNAPRSLSTDNVRSQIAINPSNNVIKIELSRDDLDKLQFYLDIMQTQKKGVRTTSERFASGQSNCTTSNRTVNQSIKTVSHRSQSTYVPWK